jgi:hypothetical protein
MSSKSLRRTAVQKSTLCYYVEPHQFTNVKENLITVTPYGLRPPAPGTSAPVDPGTAATTPGTADPKYNIKMERRIYSKKGSKLQIGNAYTTLDTNKITLAPGYKHGTISCELKEVHSFISGGDGYFLHFLGNATLNLDAQGDHTAINPDNISEYLMGLKIDSKAVTAGFKNNIHIRAPRVSVVGGTHSLFSPDDISWWQQLILTLAN